MLKAYGLLGKYRALVLAIMLFLILDFSVLAINLYSSSRAQANTLLINFTRQAREFALRIPKLSADLRIFDLNDALNASGDEVEDLRSSLASFDHLLQVFHDGGEVQDESGRSFHIEALGSADAREVLETMQLHWGETDEVFRKALAKPKLDREDINLMYSFSVLYSEQLYNESAKLVSVAQQNADIATRRLQIVQITGFTLALLNFAYTMFMTLRGLLANDRRVAIAQRETDEILSNVREGLFLLDSDCRIGEKYSRSMQDILYGRFQPGAEFLSILEGTVSAETLSSTRDYLMLLLGDRVKESLIQSLNPLAEVEVLADDKGGAIQSRFLSFQFNRVMEAGKISHLLVTIQDATRRVQLSAELEIAKTKARSELEVYLKILSKDPDDLREFMSGTHAMLMAINERLKKVAESGFDNYDAVVAFAFRGIHGMKGEASVLGLELFEALAHDFEDQLVVLRDRGNLTGSDMLKLTVRVNDLFERLSLLNSIVDRSASTSMVAQTQLVEPGTAPAAFADAMRALCERVATNQHKRVHLEVSAESFEGLPDSLRHDVREIAVQLLRNAVTHGIETPQQRSENEKSEVGVIELKILRADDGGLDLLVRDDGSGLTPARIRKSLQSEGLFTAEQVGALSDREVISKVFEPGFSTRTAGQVDVDGGRGVGLDVVHEKVQQLNGRLKLRSRIGRFTEFTIRLFDSSAELDASKAV